MLDRTLMLYLAQPGCLCIGYDYTNYQRSSFIGLFCDNFVMTRCLYYLKCNEHS